MELHDVWFVLIAVLWTGYFFLEGFDFGVGVLTKLLARDRTERRVLINTIGPVWDGNEVWLLTAGGATFAAFPEWYATLFSGFYLPLLLILVCLIVRGVAFEYRAQAARGAAGSATGSTRSSGPRCCPAFLWGVAFGNIVRGVKIDAGHGVRRQPLRPAQPVRAPRRAGDADAVHLPRRGVRRAQDGGGHPGAGAEAGARARAGHRRAGARSSCSGPRLDSGDGKSLVALVVAVVALVAALGGEPGGARGLVVRAVRRHHRGRRRDALPDALPERHAVLAQRRAGASRSPTPRRARTR